DLYFPSKEKGLTPTSLFNRALRKKKLFLILPPTGKDAPPLVFAVLSTFVLAYTSIFFDTSSKTLSNTFSAFDDFLNIFTSPFILTLNPITYSLSPLSRNILLMFYSFLWVAMELSN